MEQFLTKDFIIEQNPQDEHHFKVYQLCAKGKKRYIFGFPAEEFKILYDNFILIKKPSEFCHILHLTDKSNIGYSERMVSKTIYSDMKCYDKYIVFKRQNKYGVGVIRPDFKEIIPPIYDKIIGVSHGCVAFKQGNRYGFQSIFTDETILINKPINFIGNEFTISGKDITKALPFAPVCSKSSLSSVPFIAIYNGKDTDIYYNPLSIRVYSIKGNCANRISVDKIEAQLLDIKLGIKKDFSII